MVRNRQSIAQAGFGMVGVYRHPIFPTVPCLSSILQDMGLYKPGGVYYGADTRWAKYDMILKPQGARRDE